MIHTRKRGRPRTSDLTRAEQLRAAKRAQRRREREAGIAAVELRLPSERATQLRAATAAPRFKALLGSLLDNLVLDLEAWPVLRELAWSRSGRWILAEDALAIYERNWRFVDPRHLGKDEAALIERLKATCGAGVLNA
ncbi:MAG TPA: hypothetical protein VFV55_03445 [Usitatibacteraceae bacterium]|nr:hypothetical protein [Usitatibacteraceae bacterium]